MNIDELVGLFYHKLNGPDDATAEDAMRVVVRALRDEIAAIEGWSGAKGRIDEVFNRILGSDAGDKVAEVPDLPTRTVQLAGITKSARPDVQFEPATDPAPDVCEWTQTAVAYWRAGCHASAGPMYAIESETCVQKCTLCQRPIKFTEAK